MAPEQSSTRARYRLFGVVTVSLFVALFARLWFVQVVDAETYQEEASALVYRRIATPAPRGHILDVNGNVMVDNRLSTVLTVDRQEFNRADVDDETRAAMLADLAGEINAGGGPLVKASALAEAFDSQNYSDLEEVPLAWDVPEELMIYVGENRDRFPGLRVTKRLVRSYPYGSTAAHVLGYVGAITGAELAEDETRWEASESENPKPYRRRDEIGKTGIELLFEDELRGTPGERVYEVDNEGNVVRELTEQRVDPVPGDDVVLTLDVHVQALVESELAAGLSRARDQNPKPGEPDFVAPAGSAVVQDPRDGRVLAMASYPTFDPAELIDGVSADEWRRLNEKSSHSPILNRAIQSTYAPASTFKLFTAYAGLTEPSTTPDGGNIFGTPGVPEYNEQIYDTGEYTLQNCEGERCTFYNAGRAELGYVDLPLSIAYSSDTYYYRLGEAFWIKSAFDSEGIQNGARAFGLGQATGIELPNEKAGIIPTEELKRERHEANPEAFPFGDWFTGDNVNIAIGQGDISVTPLQLVNAYGTFANGGTLFAPGIVSEIRGHDGGNVREFGPRVRGEVELPPAYESVLLEGLVGAVSRGGGTAYSVFNDPSAGGIDFPVETFPVAGKTGTAEVDDKADTSIFVGFGPTDDPGYSVRGQEPRYVAGAVLEESGFGSDVAAPLVASVLDKLRSGEVPRALSAEERALRYQAVLDGTATTTTLLDPALDQGLEGAG